MNIDLDEDDLFDIHSPVCLSDQLNDSDIALSHKTPIVVSYALVDLGKTNYHFMQEFTHRDTQEYFRMMKTISSSTINDLMDNPHKHHFYRTDIRGNLKNVLRQIDPDCIKTNPLIYHFALYTEDQADRETGVRSPRIYFMLGLYGMIYILFFDPFHEINPLK